MAGHIATIRWVYAVVVSERTRGVYWKLGHNWQWSDVKWPSKAADYIERATEVG
jgi:hypothetical protein